MSILSVVVFFGALGVTFAFLRVSGLSFFRFSIPSFVLAAVILMAYVGWLPLYLGWADYTIVPGGFDQAVMEKVGFFAASCIVLMSAGFVFARRVLGMRLETRPDPPQPMRQTETAVIVGLLVFTAVVAAAYLRRVDSVASVLAWAADAEGVSLARSRMTNDFGGRYHWYSAFMHDVANWLLFTLMAHWLVARSWSSRLLLVTSFLLTSFTATMTAQKAPLGWILVGLFLTVVAVRHENRYRAGPWVQFGVVLAAVLVVFYMIFMGLDDPVVLSEVLSGRIFFATIATGYWHVEMFPAFEPFLLGRSFPNPGGLLPFEPYSLTTSVMDWRFPGLVASGVVGSAPTVFWGELYANFGVVGVLVLPFFVGIGLCAFQYGLERLRYSPMQIGFLVWSALHFRQLASTGLSSFLVDFYLAVVLGSLFVGYVVAGRGGLGVRKDVRMREEVAG